MQLRSLSAAIGRQNLERRSTSGITLPRRLITPFTCSGMLATGVIGQRRMISRTFSTGIPYDSWLSVNVRYLPGWATGWP